ncbi:MAG: nuclear transport factor 2 family protein, partial [Oscillibacter sp.]
MKTEQALHLLSDFCVAYFVKRNLEESLALTDENIVLIGTAEGARVYGRDAFRDYLLRDFAEMPEPFALDVLSQTAHAAGEDCAVVDMSLRIRGSNYRVNAILSAVARETAGECKLFLVHFAVPIARQKHAEHYPITMETTHMDGLKLDLLNRITAGGIMGGYQEPG